MTFKVGDKVRLTERARIEVPHFPTYAGEVLVSNGGITRVRFDAEEGDYVFYSRSLELVPESPPFMNSEQKERLNITSASILEAGLKHMKDRASTYDKPEGERSMKATVEAFNAITGHSITEEEGWLLMITLKMVRSQQGNFKLDNYEDGAAYFGLMGECANIERGGE